MVLRRAAWKGKLTAATRAAQMVVRKGMQTAAQMVVQTAPWTGTQTAATRVARMVLKTVVWKGELTVVRMDTHWAS
jgi:hypothetical protein